MAVLLMGAVLCPLFSRDITWQNHDHDDQDHGTQHILNVLCAMVINRTRIFSVFSITGIRVRLNLATIIVALSSKGFTTDR